jgi:hypothetical protein
MEFQRVPTCFAAPRGDRRVRSPLFGLLILLAVLAPTATAAAAVTVHAANEVLAEWTVHHGDALFFHGPQGEQWEYVTDINDPVIVNKGRGAFFPPPAEAVQGAIDAVDYPLQGIDLEVFILPYPRRDLLPSNAGDRCVYLSPGVAPISSQQLHALVAHELGHIVQHQLMPDGDRGGWADYRALRGITDGSIYNENAVHKNRPHEIFAEDFRFLFGGTLANYSGSIENPDLALPNRVPGLEEFLLGLAARTASVNDLPTRRRLRLFPNPTRGAVTVAFTQSSPLAGAPLTLQVFDVQGREVARREIVTGGLAGWDGRSDAGAPAPPGIYFVRVSGDRGAWTGKLLVAP